MTRREKTRMMPTLIPRCNFCLLIIHTFLERAQPASRVQAAVRDRVQVAPVDTVRTGLVLLQHVDSAHNI